MVSALGKTCGSLCQTGDDRKSRVSKGIWRPSVLISLGTVHILPWPGSNILCKYSTASLLPH